MENNLLGWQTSIIYDSKHLSPLSATGSTTTGHHRTSSLISLNPLAPAFLPHHQSSSDPPLSLCNSDTMNIPLAQLNCAMPPQIIPSHVPSINQHIVDHTLLHPLLQHTNQSQPDAAAHQSMPGLSASSPSSLQHQSNCLQAITKTIKQFSQHLKVEQLDRQTLHLILLQLQNDFALLRYLLFSPVDTIPNKHITVKDSATSPLLDSKLNPIPNAASTACTEAPKLRRLTPVGAVGTAKTKTSNTANADSQPILNTQETTIQNLTSRICKLEKLFANEVSTYTSITAEVHSQYFLLYDKIRQLEPGNSDVIIWKIPSVKFVFDSAKVARPSSDPLIEPATIFSSPIFRTHPHGYNFFIKLYPYGIGPATGKCASVLFALFPETMTIFSNGPSQRPFTSVFETSWTQ